MSNSKDPLFQLVKTLTKAEKRHFKLYVRRSSGQENLKFIQLFDLLDKQKTYNEEQIFSRAPSISKAQLSNLKRHLYQQLMISLRLIHKQRNKDIEIRENLDFAKILYNKGLYQQSVRLLERTKDQADRYKQDKLQLEVIELEKYIESAYITRSIESRAEKLAIESEKLTKVIENNSRLSNLGLKLFGLYIRTGHARNAKENQEIEDFFKKQMPEIKLDQLSFYEKLYYFQCYVWYHYIRQDFLKCFASTLRWVEIFRECPEMAWQDPTMYFKGYNFLLATLFYTNDHIKFRKYLADFEAESLNLENRLNTNGKLIRFQYLNNHRINLHFLEGTFKEGVELIPEIEQGLSLYQPYLDEHKVMVFYYKIACLYFGNNDNSHTLDYLNKIINNNTVKVGEDIQSYARILQLICHYEMGNRNLLEYIIKSVYHYLIKMKNLNRVQKEVLNFLRSSIHFTDDKLMKAFQDLKDKLEDLSNDPYEKRSFLYLDIISWLESKLASKHISEIIREKVLKRTSNPVKKRGDE